MSTAKQDSQLHASSSRQVPLRFLWYADDPPHSRQTSFSLPCCKPDSVMQMPCKGCRMRRGREDDRETPLASSASKLFEYALGLRPRPHTPGTHRVKKKTRTSVLVGGFSATAIRDIGRCRLRATETQLETHPRLQVKQPQVPSVAHGGPNEQNPTSPARPAKAWPWMTRPGNARAPHFSGGGH